MARCKAWALTEEGMTSSDVGAPGTDRRYWRLCFRKAQDGNAYCDQCYQDLASATDPRVRRMLADEGGLPVAVLERLLADLDAGVLDRIAERAEGMLGVAVGGENTTPAPMGAAEDEDEEW